MMRSVIAFAAVLGIAFADDARESLRVAVMKDAPPAQQAAISFLVGNMPSCDIGRVSAAYLRENVALAFRARDEFPWGRQIPDDVFTNDVLPYASLDEARDEWRADFLNRFRNVVAGCHTAREAMARVNARVEKETGVKYNTGRRAPNQGPLESMASGGASCTGLSILLVDALRSVGLPARIAGTAMWTTKEGNHNWVEVWLPDSRQWHFTEYHPDQAGLDHGWFVADAARALPGSLAHGIFATSWKPGGARFPMAWSMADDSVRAVEVTRRYVDLGAKTLPAPEECELRVEAVHAGGTPVRIAAVVEVRMTDVVVATGTTPGPEDDRNRYFTVRVKRGMRYQVVFRDAEEPTASDTVAIGEKESSRRITLIRPPA